MRCKACGAALTWAVNVDTNARVPLVPYDAAFPKAVRYRIFEGTDSCERDDDGPWQSHFANCPGAKQFSGRNAKT